MESSIRRRECAGGGPGALAEAHLRRSSGALEALPGSSHLVVARGESLLSLTAGGGGYDSPLDRAPARVAKDVAEGWVSVARARNVYGVVLATDGSADEAGTQAARRVMTA